MAELGARTWPEVAAAPPTLLAVPLGSVEQHGPHLPLDTDTRIALAVADGAARRTRLTVAPAVSYGASGEHRAFPGTLSIGTDVLCSVLVELGRSADDFAGVVFVNGHGGNRDALDRSLRVLLAEGRRALGWWPDLPDADLHAGRTETALLLAVAAPLVRADRAEPGDVRPLAELWQPLRTGGVSAVSANGVLGDPTGATAEEGRTLLEALVEDLVAAVERARARWAPPR